MRVVHVGAAVQLASCSRNGGIRVDAWVIVSAVSGQMGACIE